MIPNTRKFHYNKIYFLLKAFLNTGDLLVYSMFLYDKNSGGLSIRFRRMAHGFITRPFYKSLITKKSMFKYNWHGGKRILPFTKMSKKSTIFIGGDKPALVFGKKDFFQIHPINVLNGISTFSQFNHPNCENGLIYFPTSQEGFLKIGTLPINQNINYESKLNKQKIHLKCTAHHVIHHSKTNTFIIVVSIRQRNNLEIPGKRILPTYDYFFEIRLYNCKNWKIFYKYNNFYILGENEKIIEYILCLKEVWLKTVLISGKESLISYIVVGTCINKGEFYTSFGRIFLWRVCEFQETHILTKNYLERMRRFEMEIKLNQKERGPISAVCSIEGFLCLAVASKILVYQWIQEILIPCTFYDVSLFTIDLCPIKKYLVVSDAFNSVTLLFWEEDILQLIFLARDDKNLQIYATSILVHETNLNLVVSDNSDCIRIFKYKPSLLKNNYDKNTKLIEQTLTHLGMKVSKIIQLKTHPVLNNSKKYMNLFGTLNGNISILIPVSETIFKRLSSLYSLLVFWLNQSCGLNPKKFKELSNQKIYVQNFPMLDGDILWNYMSLSNYEQDNIANTIGSSSQHLIFDLQLIQRATKFY